MTRRFSVSTSLVFLTFAGCQVAQDSLPWFGANDPVYTEQQLASMNTTGPVLAENTSAQPANNPISTVSATTTTPATGTQVEQLVQSGRATIQQAGSNPVMLQQARGFFEQALQLNPQHSAANQGLAIVADLQKDWPTAEAHYKQALSQNPQDPDLLNDLGYSYLLQNRFHESTQYLNQALQVSPRHERAHINLAMLSLKRNDVAGATNRLGMIYPQQEVQTTLAQLQNELAKTATVVTPQQPGSTAPFVAGGSQPNSNPTAQAMQSWPRNAYPAPQSNPNNTSPRNNNATAGNTTRPPADERPISVYPPGVVRRQNENSAVAETPRQMQPSANSLNVPGQQLIGGANAGGQNNLVPGNSAGLQPAGQPFNGVPVGGVISTSPAMNSQHNPGVPSVSAATPNMAPAPNAVGQPFQMPNAAAAGPSAAVPQPTNAPVLGLNAGPGTLFPIPVQPTTSGAPAPYSHATQSAPLHQPVVPTQPAQNVVPAPANYGTTQNGTPVYGSPTYGAPQPNLTNGQPVPAANPYYGQPVQPSAASPGVPANGYGPSGVPNAGVNGVPAMPGYPAAMPNTAAGLSPQQMSAGQPVQNYTPPPQGAIRGVSAQNGSIPLSAASQPGTPSTAQGMAQNLTAPAVPVATAPGNSRPGPLAAYEQQLQNLDNQYNATLQNMNAQPTAVAPGGAVYR